MPERVTIDQLPEDTAVTGGEYLVLQDGATTKRALVSAVTATAGLTAHIDDTTDAHLATAIGAAPSGVGYDGATVQAQLSQLAASAIAQDTSIGAHLVDAVDAHDATAISFAPTGAVTATDVQTAVQQAATLPAALTDLSTRWTAPTTVTGNTLTMAEGTNSGTNIGTLYSPGSMLANRVWQFPDASGDVLLDTAAQTLGNKSISGAANTLSNISPGSIKYTIEVIGAATYTVVTADAGKLKRVTMASTITLPSAGPTTGQFVDFLCIVGVATFALGAGATWDVNPTPSAVARAAGSLVRAIKTGATTWALAGDLG